MSFFENCFTDTQQYRNYGFTDTQQYRNYGFTEKSINMELR